MANPLQILDIKPWGFQFIEELAIEATPEIVWTAVTTPGKWFGFDPDPNKWAKQTFNVFPGGQWISEAKSGTNILLSTVTYIEPGKLLRMTGQLGFSHLPVTVVTIFEFQPKGEGKSTLLRVGQRVFGLLDAGLEERFRGTWKKLLPNIKTLSEKMSH